MVKIEPMNRHDIHAVAIYRDTEIVSQVPYNLDIIICVIVTLLIINGCGRWLFLEVNLYCFIGVMAAGCWSELRGGCFVMYYVEINRGHLVCLLPRGWLLFGGVVNRGFTVYIYIYIIHT